MTTIVLIISSTNKPEYSLYRSTWKKEIEERKTKYPRIHYYFLEASNNISENQDLIISPESSTITVRGEDSTIPFILIKTMKSIRYLLETDPTIDFIYRTNLSTYLFEPEFSLFIEKARREKIDCAGNIVNAWNTFPFPSGSGMLLSREICDYLLENEHIFWTIGIFGSDSPNLNYNNNEKLGNQWHDDVCMGFLISQRTNIYNIPFVFPETVHMKTNEQYQCRYVNELRTCPVTILEEGEKEEKGTQFP